MSNKTLKKKRAFMAFRIREDVMFVPSQTPYFPVSASGSSADF